MGFGVLFFGYAAAYLMSLNSFGYLFKIVGAAVMLSGIGKLRDFEKSFNYLYFCGIAVALSALSEAIFAIIEPSFLPIGEASAISTAAWLLTAVPFHALLYISFYRISKEVGVMKLAGRSILGGIFLGVELLLALSVYIVGFLSTKLAWYLTGAAFLFSYVIIIFNLALIYSCYKNICEEGDEDAPVKPSKIPFLNKLFEVSEKRENEIYEKTKSYAENKIRQDNEKRKEKKQTEKKRR